MLPAAAAALCLGAYGAVFVLNQIADHTLESQQEWMADLEIQEKYARAGELDGQLAKIRQGMDEVKLMGQNLSVYPEFSGEMLRRIGDVGGDGIEFDVSGFDAETGVLTFHVKSREIIDIPAYILKLQETGLFHTVDYTGYVYEEEWYILSLSCTLEGEETGGAQ